MSALRLHLSTPRGRALLRFAPAALLLVALVAPFALAPYQVSQLTTVWIYATAVLGLNLLTGHTGQISAAQGGFFAIGAYTAAILLDRGLLPPLLTLPAGALVALLAGVALGLPALRLRGLYLALVTLAVAVVVPVVAKRADGLTGGAGGMTVDTLAAPTWSGLADDQYLYLVAVALAVAGFGLAVRMTRGASGRALTAVRDGEVTAAVVGVNIARVKLQAFGVSAAYAGAAGALYTLAVGFVAPESFTLLLAFAFLTAMIVGGARTLVGALVGALFIEYVPATAADVDPSLTGVVYGAALLLCVYLLPAGIVGALQTTRR
ncbi:branched-chain amino acid ABC transporter permease [Conexibacter woesei]|uniref:Inner-membrane translocator n=1 Tax=Conexibacter woesei (strain DSM 14684 / CCUG 47730 / CIP 108061 / JCM 11494 / NBRC 100937 / ID131577) TaxID=469383 RepID=D3F796_CONWI|nr:branched-chain amino acid ABC transporter permease [Conexibacter woesei]ADB48867.1 inner-membrane translocator [Conexibacter woesei DSM 14684]